MSATTTLRHGEDSLSAPFTAYVLLSEELEFESREILEAVVDDYPSVFWTSRLAGDRTCSTGRACRVALYPGPGRNEPKEVHLRTEGGRFQTDWETSYARSEMFFSERRAAVERHRQFVAITVASADQSVAARFEAASRMTCLAAVFAKLPTCTAVHVANSGLTVSPADWVKAADILMQNDIPLWQWIAAPMTVDADGKQPPPLTLRTFGLAAFAGREIIFPSVRTDPKELLLFAAAVAHAIMKFGFVPQDGETFDLEGAPERHIPIRHWPTGKGGVDADSWALLHSKSTLRDTQASSYRLDMPEFAAQPGGPATARASLAQTSLAQTSLDSIAATTPPPSPKKGFLQGKLGGLLRGFKGKDADQPSRQPQPLQQPSPKPTPHPEASRKSPLGSTFSAYILLSEDIEFTLSEILDEAGKVYPSLSWAADLLLDLPFSTKRFSTAPVVATKGLRDVSFINFIATPGKFVLDWADICHLSQGVFPDAASAVERHRTYFSINVSSVDESLAARFSAARRMTCLAALFARLPICTGIWLQNTNTLIPPKTWLDAADQAIDDRFPFFAWTGTRFAKVESGKPPGSLTARTIGLSSFNGREITIPQVRIAVPDIIMQLWGFMHLMIEQGHRYQDGDTLNDEDAPPPHWRIRNLPAGLLGAECDMWALLHPASELDEMATFGPRKTIPPPPGVDNTFPSSPDYLRNLLKEFNRPPTLH